MEYDCSESFSHFPRPRGVSSLSSGLDQVTPGRPLWKEPGLWLWVGLVASSRSLASGSHQTRSRGGRLQERPGKGGMPPPGHTQAHPSGAVSASRQRLSACSLAPFHWLPSLSPHRLLLLQDAVTYCAVVLLAACWAPHVSGTG